MPRLTLPVLALSLTFPLVACSSVVVDPDTVSATIVDANRAPIAGARVMIGDAILTTDSDGHFEGAANAGPYDLTILPPASSHATIFLGLLDHEPTIRLLGTVSPTPPAAPKSTEVVVTLPEKDGDSVASSIVLDVLDTTADWVSLSANPANPLESTTRLSWADAASSKARFQAFRYTVDPVTGAPKHYVGYDSAEVTLTSGVPSAWAVSWKAPPFGESTVSFPVHRSPGQGDLFTWLRIQSPWTYFVQQLAHGKTSGPEVSFVVPDLAGAVFNVLVSTSNNGAPSSTASVPSLVAGVEGATVELPPNLILASPKEGDTLGPGSKIQWSTEGQRANFVAIVPADYPSHDRSYTVYTAGGSVVVPDLSALGIPLPSGMKYTVRVKRDSWSPTVDDAAATPWEASFDEKPLDIAESAVAGVVIQ